MDKTMNLVDFVMLFRTLSPGLEIKYETFRGWLNRGILPFERTVDGELVVTARVLVKYHFVITLAAQGGRGKKLRDLWNLVEQAFRDTDDERGRTLLWCDVGTGLVRASVSHTKGRLRDVPDGFRVIDLQRIERAFHKRFRGDKDSQDNDGLRRNIAAAEVG